MEKNSEFSEEVGLLSLPIQFLLLLAEAPSIAPCTVFDRNIQWHIDPEPLTKVDLRCSQSTVHVKLTRPQPRIAQI